MDKNRYEFDDLLTILKDARESSLKGIYQASFEKFKILEIINKIDY